MKLSGEYVIREFNDVIYAVPTGETADKLGGAIRINASCRVLWEALIQGTTKEGLVKALLNRYDIDAAVAEKDVEEFISKIKEARLTEEN